MHVSHHLNVPKEPGLVLKDPGDKDRKKDKGSGEESTIVAVGSDSKGGVSVMKKKY